MQGRGSDVSLMPAQIRQALRSARQSPGSRCQMTILCVATSPNARMGGQQHRHPARPVPRWRHRLRRLPSQRRLPLPGPPAKPRLCRTFQHAPRSRRPRLRGHDPRSPQDPKRLSATRQHQRSQRDLARQECRRRPLPVLLVPSLPP